MPDNSFLDDVNAGWTKTTCPYCGVGCGVEAKPNEDGTLSVRGDVSHPANYGRLCSKGLALGETTIPDGRLLDPYVDGEKVSWNKALDHVADGLSKTIKKYGPESVALYVSGQILTEDYYVANKLVKGYFGTGNIDTNSRLCMSSSVAGHKRAFGTDTVPNCYEDFELTDLLILVGSNLAWCHPVIYQRVKAAKEARPNMKVVVIDPRETDSCEIADLHLAIQPGTDVLLFNGLFNYLVSNERVDKTFVDNNTQGFAEALETARSDSGSDGVDFLQLSRQTGVPIPYLQAFYQWFAETDKTLTVYSQGVNQSSRGTDKVNSMINCHLITGRIGREGCGPFSITGQPNAMGGREVGGLANMLASHMEFGNEGHWQTVSDFWKAPNLAKKPGLKAVDMFNAIHAGEIKAVWIMATNPVVSLPNADRIKEALDMCPLVIVSDCIADTDTTRYANVLLPAEGWSEKSGTVTNSERRISRQRQLIASSGQAKPDWWALCEVALRMGYDGFNFTSAADIFREYAEMTGVDNNGTRDLDISPLASITNDGYDSLHPQQWPLTTMDKKVTQKRFFAEGNFYTPTGRANIVAVTYQQPATEISPEYPMVLNTGRIRDQWHTMTRTGLVPKLNAHKPEPYVQVNPQDARCFQLKEGDIAELESRWGFAKARVVISPEMNPGQIFMPMHWNNVQSSEGRVCAVISPDVDPISGQPESKFTPVAIKPWAFEQEAIVLSREPIEIEGIGYWAKRRVDGGGWIYSLAHIKEGDEPTLIELLKALPQLTQEGNRISFDNPSKTSFRTALMVDGVLQVACIAGPRVEKNDFAWLDGLLAKEMNTDIQRSILSATAADSLITGRQICACKQVGELTIIDAITDGSANSVESLGECTGAGTGCGSCIGELKQLLAKHGNVEPA